MRFGPLTDHLPHKIQRKVLDLYEKILTRWRRFPTKRSRYFYNRKLMFRFLFCKVTDTPFTDVLQNLDSQRKQINEMEYLLENDPPLLNRPVPKKTIWDLFDEYGQGRGHTSS